MFTPLPVVGALLLSVIVPVGIFLGRSNIRASRFEIVNDLEKLFSFARKRAAIRSSSRRSSW